MKTIVPKNIISIMVGQHEVLQKEVKNILDLSSSGEIKCQEIFNILSQFKNDLVEHLNLENEVFYVELLKEMEKAGQDTTKTRLFIGEMKDIEKVVYAFLEKFKDASSIEGAFLSFKKEFSGIVEVLVLRIEAEEAGVYSYWGLF